MMLRWLSVRWREDERLRFVAVGGWNTLFGYFAFAALYGLLHRELHYMAIGAIAQAVAMVNAYVAHRVVVFRSRGPWLPEFVRFTMSQLVLVGLGLAALWLLVRMVGLDPLVAQALVTVVSVVVSYLAHRRFSFAIR